MVADEHRRKAAERGSPLRCAIVTVSDTRTPATDGSGQLIGKMLTDHGLDVAGRNVVPDEPARVDAVLSHWLGQDSVDAVLLNGGTGVSARDGTVEVVRARLEREIPGFGELFRYLSYQEIGAASMLSRALAGVAKEKAVFALPGSTKAVALAMEKLILPELPHIVYEVQKDG